MSIGKPEQHSDILSTMSALFEDTHYTILNAIAEGGFSVVCKALNQKTGQHVAIKTLKVDLLKSDTKSNENNRVNLNQEADIYAKLNHPNIVTLLDRGISKGVPFIAFEYIKGHSLKDELFVYGSLTPAKAVDIMCQVLHALSHAHEHGIVHNDIKPSNILLIKQNNKTHVKLIDFGVGTFSDQQMKNASKKVGTPSYCAPEQLTGDPTTSQSDIYTWGLVLLECLTAETAVTGSSIASIFQQQLRCDDILLPEHIAVHPLSIVLQLALKKSTEHRSSNASEVAQKLANVDVSTLINPTVKNLSRSNDLLNVKEVSSDETIVIDENDLTQHLNKPHAATVMCITISLQNESVNKTSDLDEALLERLYEERKNLCINVAQRYGGQLAGNLVDTLLFYFGSPDTIDVDSRLCAKAALELTNALNQPTFLQRNKVSVGCVFYIGIHSGLTWRNNDSFPQGELPRVAMTLAKEADANQILCSQFTHNILTSHAHFESTLNEASDDYRLGQPSYALLSEHAQTSVDSIRFTSNLVNFIGREYELRKLESLIENVSNTRDKHRRCAHIHGEGGIGKSRMIAELCIKKGHLNIWSMQCKPENQKRELSPFLTLIKRLYGLDILPQEDGLQQLHKRLNRYPTDNLIKSTAVLFHWLGIESPHEAPVSIIPKTESKKILYDLLIYLLCDTKTQPGKKRKLFILDDLHWVDSTTLEFIAILVSSSAFQRSGHSLLTSSRQALPPELYGQITHVVKINRLDNKEAFELITASLNNQHITEQMADFILRRTNGIPLFIIEFVRMLKENQWIQHLNGKVSLIQTHAIPLIPYTLRDSLEQRLENLTCDKKVVQFASAIGEEFDYDALKYTMGPSTIELNMTLNELLKHDVIRIKRRGGKKNFVFKHALLRDAAFNSMPYSLRLEAQELICHSRQEQAQSLNNDTESDR